jgi:hypothetical protein
MPFLLNFPNFGQLDDTQEKNRQYDCVPACLANALSYLTGRTYDAAKIKDVVYGSDYVGPTDPEQFVDYCADQGISLSHIDGDGPTLVKAARAQLARGLPVIATEPDPYVDPGLGLTHAICFYKWDEPKGTLSARDPYSKQDVVHTDGVWASVLQFRQIWVLSKLATQPVVNVPKGWTDDSSSGTLTAPNGFRVVRGFRRWVLSHPWNPEDWPLENEQGYSQIELSNPSLGGGTKQRFRMTTLEWTARRGVFVAWTGQELIELERRLRAALTQTAFPPALKQQIVNAIQEAEKAIQAVQTLLPS